MLMRRKRVVDSPGGPWALELNAAAGASITGSIRTGWRGMLGSTEDLAASISLNKAKF
jgi:hypothetical protein